MRCYFGTWSFVFLYCSLASPHYYLSISLKTGGKRKQVCWNTKTSFTGAGWQCPGWDTGLPVAGGGHAEGGHLMSCVALPGNLKRDKEHNLGRAGLTGRPRRSSPATGSPWGQICGFSPVRRNTQHGHPAMHSSTLPSTGVPGIPHPPEGCRCGSSTFVKMYFCSEGFFVALVLE